MEKTNRKWMEDTIDALGIVAATVNVSLGFQLVREPTRMTTPPPKQSARA